MFKIIDEQLINKNLTNTLSAEILTFAHYGEAQVFIESLSLYPLSLAQKNESYPVQMFWNNPETDAPLIFLLITGEGFIKCTETLSAFLALFFQLNIEITQIKNFGVAGALSPTLQLKKCYFANSVLWQKSHPKFGLDLDFYSYQSLPSKQNLTCLTTPERISSDEIRIKFVAVAEIIDRELAAIAHVAFNNHIPWLSMKVISDYAKENNMCNMVLEHARDYSQLLWDSYQQSAAFKLSIGHPHSCKNDIWEQFISSLYFTESMKRKWQSLVPILLKQEKEKNEQFLLSSQKQLDSSPLRAKEKAQLFLDLTVDYLHPKQALLKKHLKELNNEHISFSWSSDFARITMRGEFQNAYEYQNILQHLEKKQAIQFTKLLNGGIFE